MDHAAVHVGRVGDPARSHLGSPADLPPGRHRDRRVLCAPLDSEEAKEQDAGCEQRKASGDLSLGVVPASMEGRIQVSDSAVGLAIPTLDGTPASHAYVLHGRVEKTASEIRCPSPKLLGVVMVHEVGHLLLGRAHSPRGLMSAKWDKRVLGEISLGQLALMRSGGCKLKPWLGADRRRPTPTAA